MLETWTAQLAHIEKVANFWCNFSIICGVIGFVLAVACAVWLILLIKNTEVGNEEVRESSPARKAEGIR